MKDEQGLQLERILGTSQSLTASPKLWRTLRFMNRQNLLKKLSLTSVFTCSWATNFQIILFLEWRAPKKKLPKILFFIFKGKFLGAEIPSGLKMKYRAPASPTGLMSVCLCVFASEVNWKFCGALFIREVQRVSEWENMREKKHQEEKDMKDGFGGRLYAQLCVGPKLNF